MNAIDDTSVKLVSTSLEKFLVSLVQECKEMEELEEAQGSQVFTMDTLQTRYMHIHIYTTCMFLLSLLCFVLFVLV